MLGQVLGGRYKIISKLGGGGFGQTYLAQDAQLPGNPQCVVKQLKPQTADLATARRLFEREATTLHQLGWGHDQIPRLFAHFEEKEEFYLVEEFYEGNTLSEELQQVKRLSEVEAIALLQDILLTLKYVHGHNVIHRDIKPSNIIRRKQDGKLVLIDFGVVKLINEPGLLNSSETNAKTVAVSTYGYTPPEQQSGHPRLNSDIYALGVTVIRVLTGKEIRELQGNLYSWRESVSVSDLLATILDKMVRLDYRERYQSVDEVLADLQGLTEGFNHPTMLGKTQNADTQATTQIRNTQQMETQLKQTVTSSTVVVEGSGPRSVTVKLWYFLAIIPVAGAVFGGWKLYEPMLYRDQGMQQLEKYQPEKALDTFQKLIDSQPNDALAWKGRGDALLELGRYERALSAYEKAIQLSPNNAKFLNKKGAALYKLQRYPEALDAHEQALKAGANDAEGWYGKGMAFIGLKRYEEALAAFDQARAIQPQSPAVWYTKGLALQFLNRQPEALKIYEEAIATYDEQLKSHPDHLQWWVDRGSVLSKLGRFQDVIDSVEKVLKVNPDFYPALLLKGNTLRLMGKPDEALQAYNKALEIRPEDYLTLHNRGALLAEKQDFVAALQSFDKALEIRPTFSPAWVDRGMVLNQNNQQKEAIQSFDKALSFDPTNYQALVGKGIALTAQNRNEEALAAFDKAKEIEPKDPYVWANRGSVLEKLQQNSEAVKSYDEAIRIQPDFQAAIEARKKLREKLGS